MTGQISVKTKFKLTRKDCLDLKRIGAEFKLGDIDLIILHSKESQEFIMEKISQLDDNKDSLIHFSFGVDDVTPQVCNISY